MSEFWYPDFNDPSWTETPEQTASRVEINRQILECDGPHLIPWDEPSFVSFKKVIPLGGITYGSSLADYSGVLITVDKTVPIYLVAAFGNLRESLIDIDSTQYEDGSSMVNDRFEQVLGIERLARVALADMVHVVSGPLSQYRHLDLE